MKKLQFFLEALKAHTPNRYDWVVRAFSLTQPSDKWKDEQYPYQLVPMGNTMFFNSFSEDGNSELVPIEDYVQGEPLFKAKEEVTVPAGALLNLKTQVKTTYGRLLANHLLLVWPFGAKLDYVNDRFSVGAIEEKILELLKDANDIPKGQEVSFITVPEYLNFRDAAMFISTLSQLFTPAGTEKSLSTSPEMGKLKARLLEENKDRLHDPATIAKIETELVKLDREWLKGDRSEDFLINGKSFNIVRKKMFSMAGAEKGLAQNVDVKLISTPLSEGWDVNNFDVMNDSLRAGGYNRGKLTEMGGAKVKELMRASAAVKVGGQDCGSTVTTSVTIGPENVDLYNQLYFLSAGKPKLYTAEDSGNYLGKTLQFRTPLYCKMKSTDYCEICLGKRLSLNPSGVPAAITATGSTFMYIYMSAAHAKQLAVAKLNYKTAIT